ncbi:MAG: asparagine synthase (glutamine-hydrolyzing) [Alphaproteobacteria bacterium]|uniref:asparagine synthase (glutamine-hydrolyzing) n=1 Tax=Candidatus Nitrobium versatile TaxID=2884831 RepID=A0A953J5N8_9BACT|nr:asparagine synthase (glutamine-hydrolyzing) [Candidatus Nitrobium versatile]
MCGIAGICRTREDGVIEADTLRAMAALLRHRGPDGTGFYRDEGVGLAHTRLSIIDPEGGRQPMSNEDGTVWITFNGEIFNYRELRTDLEQRGHLFSTKSDTEVILHLYEDFGPECLHFLNGQFAFALWDKRKQRLFLARDRVGIRPLFYTKTAGVLLFASEVKSLFMHGEVKRELDLYALDQVFTFWTTIPPRTAFRDIRELPAGHYMVVQGEAVTIRKYWDPEFEGEEGARAEGEYAEELRSLLIDAVRLQLRADVPVGAYLSGGIDSSVIALLIRRYTGAPLRTFSVTFEESQYDESAYQRQMAGYLDTEHLSLPCAPHDIGRVFPDVIWHTERPVVRTAPAPLYLLSGLVRSCGYKVVLTGEGADEILAGYDIFKEVKVRRFIERQPGSKMRSRILKRLYPYLADSPVRSVPYAEAFFGGGPASFPAEYYSHLPRWNTTAKAKTFFSGSLRGELRCHDTSSEMTAFLREGVRAHDDLSRAQYLEMKILLPGYILSSQGDRVAMAHSVEGRFPFLDHRVVEFCCALPPHLRMKVLTEKYLLKESMKGFLPDPVIRRAKQPYRAPDAKSFFSGGTPGYTEELLSEDYVKRSGYFDPRKVSFLVEKCRKSPVLGYKDNMAFVGILSTLLLHALYIDTFGPRRSGALRKAEEERYAGKG